MSYNAIAAASGANDHRTFSVYQFKTTQIPATYDFQLIGQENLDSGQAYVLQVSPKIETK